MRIPIPASLAEKSIAGSRNRGLLVTLLAALLLISAFSPRYLTVDNLKVVALQVSYSGIASLGTALLIIGGKRGSRHRLRICFVRGDRSSAGKDDAGSLSVELRSDPRSRAGTAQCPAGLLVLRVRISPIIITLGTLTIFRGLALRVTNGFGVRGVPTAFSALGRSHLLGLPLPVWLLMVLAIAAHLILEFTREGRHLFAFGGNRQAAEAAGINGTRLVVAAFTLNGALVGLSAVLAASRFGSAAPTFGAGFELDVIAAVVLAGVAFAGGEGSILGVLLAVLLLGEINSGLISVGIDPHYAQLVKGVALVVAVTLDQLTEEQQQRHRKRIALEERLPAA